MFALLSLSASTITYLICDVKLLLFANDASVNAMSLSVRMSSRT